MLNRIELRVALARKETSLAAACRVAEVDYSRVVRNLGGYGPALTPDEEGRVRRAAGLLHRAVRGADCPVELVQAVDRWRVALVVGLALVKH